MVGEYVRLNAAGEARRGERRRGERARIGTRAMTAIDDD
jgi:hypothetical protein